MAKCSNCEAPITCGCQRAVASNGVHVCTKCKARYEELLIATGGKVSNAPTNLRIKATRNIKLKP